LTESLWDNSDKQTNRPEVNMPLNGSERMALENDKRALARELESVNNEIAVARLGGNNSQRISSLQIRRSSTEARLQSIDARLRQP
jgi:hypothetical protein